MRKAILCLACALFAVPAFAQQYITRSARVHFFSETPFENIEATNNEAAAVLDLASGLFQVIVPIKSFQFEKALMQRHFNENYLESDRYPNADFKGTIENIKSINFRKDGRYPVVARGKLSIHGVSRDVRAPGILIVKSGAPTAEASFMVRCADYQVKIPSVVSQKIAEVIKVSLSAPMSPR
ncbi:MAG: YceI family protein [Bacteroidetes bacterium]|nr:YceI family protein [Bacteroidota bacterium]MBS1628600.1 YceI family protein [Bacteroidota bacterium]